MADIEQALAAMGETELRDCLREIVTALHAEDTDKCYNILCHWGLANIDDLLAFWEERLVQGEEVSAAELCKDAPHLLTEVERGIKALKAMRWMCEPG